MLKIIVGEEGFNESTQEFETINPVVLCFEHSLVSLSKWESEFERPFLSTKGFTEEEVWGYIKAMLLTPNVPDEVLAKMSTENHQAIQNYIDSRQSATTFGVMPETSGKAETITSELIYYWMVAFDIPWEAETWHINRLFSLIRICNIKNSKPKKQSTHEARLQRAKLNAERRERLGTRG